MFEDWPTAGIMDVIVGRKCGVEIEFEDWITLETTLERMDKVGFVLICV